MFYVLSVDVERFTNAKLNSLVDTVNILHRRYDSLYLGG